MLKNEEKWVWYSLVSVVGFVEDIIIYDTGSTDRTVEIVEEFIKRFGGEVNIIFEQKGSTSKENFFKLRQEQIDRTRTDWFLVLDGDEIWYRKDLQLVSENLSSDCDMIAIRFHNAIGDVFHAKDYNSESYMIKGIKGSITLKVINRNIHGLACKGDYGVEGYVDSKNRPIQYNEDRIKILDGKFFHASYLQRSSSLRKDWEIPYRRRKVFSKPDYKVTSSFEFPEAFYMERPEFVESPFRKRGCLYVSLMILHYIMRFIK